MKSDPKEYFVIFDTNALYHTYDKRADFSTFSFNSTYDNVVDLINQLDIYEQVVIVIPAVVWKEMERHIISAHQLKVKEFREKVAKLHFPEIAIEDKGSIDYPKFIHPIIDEYRENLSSNINKVIELPLASEARYQSILRRAFEKRPPFEGKDKKSDKGFKDALLWESILEFTAQHDTANIIYYSQDSAFGCELQEEFASCFPNATIAICPNENMVKQCLESWAKEIDIYAYTPIKSYDENKDVIDWLQSSAPLIQEFAQDFGLVEKSRLIIGSEVHLASFDNIQIINQTDDKTEYSVEAVLELTYTLNGGVTTKESIDVCIIISQIFDELFAFKDMYMSNEVDIENSSSE